jgi:hypothetical protein
MPEKTKSIDKKSSRDGEVRCLACFERFDVPRGTEKMSCPKCQLEWRISWPYPQTAKIRGPVWNKLPR